MDNSVVVNKCGLCGQEYRLSQDCFLGTGGHAMGYHNSGKSKCFDGSISHASFVVTNDRHDICPMCAVKQMTVLVVAVQERLPEIMKNPLPRGGC